MDAAIIESFGLAICRFLKNIAYFLKIGDI